MKRSPIMVAWWDFFYLVYSGKNTLPAKEGNIIKKGGISTVWKKYRLIVKRKIYRNQIGEVIIEYHFMIENGIYLGYLRLPGDAQWNKDGKCLDVIMKALSFRWELIKPKK